jgi:cytochrome c554/c'-like protein
MVRYTLATTLILGLAGYGAAGLAQPAPSPDPAAYSWAESCRKCHEPIYKAWAATKHATALDRLSAGDQEKECIGCHVTGPKSRVAEGRTVLNRGVQCEACHGGAAAHAADPAVRTGLTKVPAESVCVECHSDKGPHFKGFFYSAMAGLSHRVS